MTPEQKTLAKKILTDSKKVREIAQSFRKKSSLAANVPSESHEQSIASIYRMAASEAKRSAKFLLRGLVEGPEDIQYTGFHAKAIVTMSTASDLLHVSMDFESQAREEEDKAYAKAKKKGRKS